MRTLITSLMGGSCSLGPCPMDSRQCYWEWHRLERLHLAYLRSSKHILIPKSRQLAGTPRNTARGNTCLKVHRKSCMNLHTPPSSTSPARHTCAGRAQRPASGLVRPARCSYLELHRARLASRSPAAALAPAHPADAAPPVGTMREAADSRLQKRQQPLSAACYPPHSRISLWWASGFRLGQERELWRGL